jgi:nucleotide-binding universal stress UspA family protein
MSCKSIIAVASGESEDSEVLAAAAALAARLGARVRVLPAFPDPAADFVYYGATLARAPKEAVDRIVASERKAQDQVEALAAEAAAREGLAAGAVSVDKRELQPAMALAPAVVLADLALFGAAAARGPLAGLFAETLIANRAPCLLIKGAAPLSGAAAVAWDGSAQAGRAVRSALPLLQGASRVSVLRNVDDRGAQSAAADPERLIAYLALHGVTGASVRDVRGDRVAPSLLAGAREEKCDVLVAGAYGRPRLYELVLGGTTRALTEAPDPPHVLLTH